MYVFEKLAFTFVLITACLIPQYGKCSVGGVKRCAVRMSSKTLTSQGILSSLEQKLDAEMPTKWKKYVSPFSAPSREAQAQAILPLIKKAQESVAQGIPEWEAVQVLRTEIDKLHDFGQSDSSYKRIVLDSASNYLREEQLASQENEIKALERALNLTEKSTDHWSPYGRTPLKEEPLLQLAQLPDGLKTVYESDGVTIAYEPGHAISYDLLGYVLNPIFVKINGVPYKVTEDFFIHNIIDKFPQVNSDGRKETYSSLPRSAEAPPAPEPRIVYRNRAPAHGFWYDFFNK